MQKSTDYHKRRRKLNFLVFASYLILALLVIFLETASGSIEYSTSPGTDSINEQTPARSADEAKDLKVTLNSHENLGLFKKIRPIDILYVVGGIGTAFLTLFIYPRVDSIDTKTKKSYLEVLHSLEIGKTLGIEKKDQDNFELRKRRFLTSIPVLCISLAEILIFLGKIGIAVWLHIGILIVLSVSNILVKDTEVQKIHQALMLLPILRLINLSMPVFFEATLYTFIFIYGSLAIPVAAIIIYQRHSFEQIGISMKNIKAYMALSIPLGLILGLGEYLTIRTDYLIPDLTFENLLKLTCIMVFFVGLIEELIFRSILQTRLEHALSIGESLLITSLLFGLMHSGYGTVYEILYTSFVGFLMGFAFYKTKSLPFIAVLHGFINVFLFGILPHYLSGWTGL